MHRYVNAYEIVFIVTTVHDSYIGKGMQLTPIIELQYISMMHILSQPTWRSSDGNIFTIHSTLPYNSLSSEPLSYTLCRRMTATVCSTHYLRIWNVIKFRVLTNVRLNIEQSKTVPFPDRAIRVHRIVHRFPSNVAICYDMGWQSPLTKQRTLALRLLNTLCVMDNVLYLKWCQDF